MPHIPDEIEILKKENDALASELLKVQRTAATERKERIKAEAALSWYITHNVRFYR